MTGTTNRAEVTPPPEFLMIWPLPASSVFQVYTVVFSSGADPVPLAVFPENLVHFAS
jgi:hypothetical protein